MLIEVLIYLGLVTISYCLGCFSIARFIAKKYKSMNIYKVGTGHPDTENIYSNISKALGILAGVADFGKIYLYLFLIRFLILRFVPDLTSEDIMRNHFFLSLGFVMIIGHCLPASHHFKGGRGIFTYMGLVTFFAPYPMLIIAFLSLFLVIFFKQIRFAQYMIVLMPPFINFLFPGGKEFLGKMFIVAIMMALINFFVSKRLGEI